MSDIPDFADIGILLTPEVLHHLTGPGIRADCSPRVSAGDGYQSFSAAGGLLGAAEPLARPPGGECRGTGMPASYLSPDVSLARDGRFRVAFEALL